ncbi:MAG: PA2779 family protein [Proteobacteria bacterium]|nr:PA2779 family protein [Pseudomonadota bacterium]
MTSLPMIQPASAAVISTETAIEMAERQGRIDHINEVLARESVQSTLIRYGVDPVDASARVDALSDAELQTLEQQLEQLPAGGTGVVEVVGIVTIVLIILELLGVTNFFSEF